MDPGGVLHVRVWRSRRDRSGGDREPHLSATTGFHRRRAANRRHDTADDRATHVYKRDGSVHADRDPDARPDQRTNAAANTEPNTDPDSSTADARCDGHPVATATCGRTQADVD